MRKRRAKKLELGRPVRVGDTSRIWFSESQPIASVVTTMQRMISDWRTRSCLLLLKKLS